LFSRASESARTVRVKNRVSPIWKRHFETCHRPDMETAQSVLDFWFGDELYEDGTADEEIRKRWFTSNPAFDEEIRTRFGALHAKAMAGELKSWESDGPLDLAALVIVLDQFSRNLFRDDPRAFAGDAKALELTLRAVEAGWDKELPLDIRSFLYMPLMHAENLEVQQRGMQIVDEWRSSQPLRSRFKIVDHLNFAAKHRDVIARFGRFPRRNKALGRTSTPEEVEYMKTPGAF
jgi:uncharacterized protein (DUF924 family)